MRVSNFIICILLLSMLPEFSLSVNIPVCAELESKGEVRAAGEIKSGRNDFCPDVFFRDMDLPGRGHSIQLLNYFIAAFEPCYIPACFYYPSELFNHSPPIL